MATPYHRKYRPKKLDTILGQDAVKKSLANVIKKRSSQAIIFTGPSGVGKTSLARIFATAMGCSKNNINEIDAATNTGIDKAREMARSIQYYGLGTNTSKAIIIDEAHRLTTPAWESLQKPIEEPPDHAFWILCTTQPDKIPKTIKTRCPIFDLHPIQHDEINSLLRRVVKKEKLKTPKVIISFIADNCEGSARQALVNLNLCEVCTSVTDAKELLAEAEGSVGIIDLCRWLIGGKNKNWSTALKLIKKLDNENAESCRLVIINYVTAVLKNTQNDRKAQYLLSILEVFSGESYNQSEKMAPLILAVAETIFGGDDA